MKTLVNFAKSFNLNVVVMEGPGFSVEVRNGILSTNNEPALRAALEKDLNSPNPMDRACANEMLDIIRENSLICWYLRPHQQGVFKGIKPNIETQSRYESNYGKKYYRYDFESYSLINDIVFCKRTALKYNPENGDSSVDYPATSVKLTYGEWMNMTADVQEIINKFLSDESK